MSRFAHVLTAAVAVIPGPAGTMTFVRQRKGPYAGSWLLPGGGVEVGETAEHAARREAHEETGCEVGALDLFGVYELTGTWDEGRYHLVLFGFATRERFVVPAGFAGHNVDAVVQRRPDDIALHSTDLRILTGAGVISCTTAEIDAALAADRIVMSAHVVRGTTRHPVSFMDDRREVRN
jgi:8-oxo-dGTP diphosphatase